MRCRSRDLAVVAAAGVVVTLGARAARDGTLRGVESLVFARVNGLTDRVLAPAWAVMQIGSIGGSTALGAAVAAAGHLRLGRHIAAAGAAAWLGSKTVKPFVGRGRPQSMLDDARVLGREQTGLGYPSGHAAVAMAVAAAVVPHAPRMVRPVLWSIAIGVGATRIYVGAHLPLDIAGGIALGIGSERAVRLLAGSLSREPSRT